MLEKTKASVFDARGGNVNEEIKQYPIAKLKLLSTIGSGGKKVYNRCTENVLRILNAHPDLKDRFRFDKWTQKMEIKKGNRWFDLTDEDYVPIQCAISAMYAQFRLLSKPMTIDAVNEACQANSYDSAIDYVRGIEWDGFGRIDSWLEKAYGCQQTEYHKAVGANFFKGIVKRIIQPGCKFDTVMIVEGKQGCGKSTSLSIIAGKWYLETTASADSKDFFTQFKGKLLIEFSEGEILSRSDTKKMKAIISTAVDTYRVSYGRIDKDYPRRCVFTMTTNQENYLKDETGNRRFLPVVVENEMVDLDWIKRNRDQMFAEALNRVEILEESVHEYPREEAEKLQKEKMEENPFHTRVQEWSENPKKYGVEFDAENAGITVSDVWEYALGGNISRLGKAESAKIIMALKNLGYESKKLQISGIRKWRWFKCPSEDGHLDSLDTPLDTPKNGLGTLI